MHELIIEEIMLLNPTLILNYINHFAICQRKVSCSLTILILIYTSLTSLDYSICVIAALQYHFAVMLAAQLTRKSFLISSLLIKCSCNSIFNFLLS